MLPRQFQEFPFTPLGFCSKRCQLMPGRLLELRHLRLVKIPVQFLAKLADSFGMLRLTFGPEPGRSGDR
jgi:hypothetical protein